MRESVTASRKAKVGVLGLLHVGSSEKEASGITTFGINANLYYGISPQLATFVDPTRFVYAMPIEDSSISKTIGTSYKEGVS